jgi:hypothetical protein
MRTLRYLTVDNLDIAKKLDQNYEFIEKQEEQTLTSPTGEEYLLPERYLILVKTSISRRILCSSTGIRRVRTKLQ